MCCWLGLVDVVACRACCGVRCTFPKMDNHVCPSVSSVLVLLPTHVSKNVVECAMHLVDTY